jgi:hypothetical protein
LIGPMGLVTIRGRFRATVDTMAGEGNATDGHFYNSAHLTANRLRRACKTPTYLFAYYIEKRFIPLGSGIKCRTAIWRLL